MKQNTGYLALDLNGETLSGTSVSVPGLFNKIGRSNKVCLICNFENDTLTKPFFANFVAETGDVTRTVEGEDGQDIEETINTIVAYNAFVLVSLSDSGAVAQKLSVAMDDKVTMTTVELPIE